MLTEEQARAAYASGSVTVVAGAGTGKTHMLTERYLHHIMVDSLSPLQIVAVTFTERAADELKARIRSAATEQLSERDPALVELEGAQISTLHALAARVCRDHPEAAGVPPDFSVLDDLEGGLWLNEQLNTALSSLPQSVLDELPFELLEAALPALLSDPLSAREALAHGSETWERLAAEARDAALTQLRADPAWQDAVRTLYSYAGDLDDKKEQARQHALSGLACLASDPVVAFEHFGRINRSGGKKGSWPQGGLAEVNEALKVIQDCTKAALKDGLITLRLGAADEELAYLLPPLRLAFEHTLAATLKAKREARVLDFADLETHALKALEMPAVREHYRVRWKAVLVDEFQDTNPVQEKLLNFLTEGATVTVVGDEKQSIYGFRGADVTVFRRYRERIIGSGGAEVTLSESFRTHAPLVAQINGIFKPLLGDLHQELTAVRLESPLGDPFVSLHTVTAERGVSKLQRRVAEAREIARCISEMLTDKTQVFDKALRSTRDLRPGDVAVLTRTWAPLDVYAEVLPALGVPAVHTGGGNLLDTREAKDAIALLRFLADVHDNLALAALLRSPFFAVDDASLYAFARSCADASWWEVLPNASPDSLQRAYEVLSTLRASTPLSAPSRLLQRADYLTGYSAVLANLPSAERRLADWRGFFDLVRTLEGGLGDVFSVTRRLRRLLGAGAEVNRPVLQADNAVALLTIHKSKGLEWPVVIVADLDYAGRNSTPDVLFDRNLGVALKLDDGEGGALEPVLYTLLKKRHLAKAAEEEARVYYVALTRARDRLILTATQDKGGGVTLLAPGLDDQAVPCNAVTFEPSSALYPDAPAPSASTVTEDVRLFEAPVSGLGEYARYVSPKAGRTPARSLGKDAWEEALFLTGAVDDTWLPLLEAVRAAGEPAPDPDSVFRELTTAGTVTPYQAVCMWPSGENILALVDAAVPEGSYDQTLLRVNPDAPGESASRITALLEGVLCAS